MNQPLPKRLTAGQHGLLLYFDHCVTADEESVLVI